MSGLDFELVKNSASEILKKFGDTLQTVSKDRYVGLAKTSLETAAFKITDNKLFLANGVTAAHIVSVFYILIGFCFLFFGSSFVQMAVSSAGFAFGVTMTFFLTALFSIELGSEDQAKIILFLAVAVICGIIFAAYFSNMFSTLVSILSYLAANFVLFKLTQLMIPDLLKMLHAEKLKTHLFYLDFYGGVGKEIPYFGLIALNVFLFLVCIALNSIHIILPLVFAFVYLSEAYRHIPYEKYEFAANLVDLAAENLKSFPVPAGGLVLGAAAAVNSFWLSRLFGKRYSAAALRILSTAAGAFLVGLGVESLLRLLQPDLAQRLAVFDGVTGGFEFNFVSVVATVVCVLAGMLVNT